MSKMKKGVLGVALGAVAAATAYGAAKMIDKEQKEIELRKQRQVSNTKLQYDPTESNKSISILSHHGRFITAYKNGSVACNQKKRSNEQTFISVPIHNEDNKDKTIKVALKSFNNTYISITNDGIITCNSADIGKNETLIVEKTMDKKSGSELWSFKSCNNKYVSAQFITGKLSASKDIIDNWEKFRIRMVVWDDDNWE